MVSIMQEYNLDIQHIPGKVNPSDHLSRQSFNQAIEYKKVARTENDKFAQRMRIPEDASDAQIQQMLCLVSLFADFAATSWKLALMT